MCEISSSFPYSSERWHQSKSYLSPEQEHLLLLTSFASDDQHSSPLSSKLASVKSATCTREPETYHRVHKPFKSTSFTMRTTISVGYGVKFHPPFQNHKKDCTNPNYTWHLSRSTSYSLCWSWPQTVLFKACTSPISIQPLSPPNIATWTREEDLFIISGHYHKS